MPLRSAEQITLRETVRSEDRGEVRRMVAATDFFRLDEIDVAVELVDTRLEKGVSSGYEFIFAEQQNHLIAYACYGPIACSVGSFDLYWIVVDPACQGRGLGRRLLQEVEQRICQTGGRHIYIETSGQPKYEPTRGFYERCGYEIAAVLTDFYDNGDDKLIWCKKCVPIGE